MIDGYAIDLLVIVIGTFIICEICGYTRYQALRMVIIVVILLVIGRAIKVDVLQHKFPEPKGLPDVVEWELHYTST